MKTKFKIFFIVLLIVLPLLGVSCGLTKATPTPVPTSTATLVPTITNTPTFTSSPLPTSTNTPLPPTATATITPDLKATQIAEQEQAARDALAALDLPADTGYLGWSQDEDIALTLDGRVSQWVYKPFAEGVTAADFVISTDMTWDTNGVPYCGFWYRMDDRGDMGNFYSIIFLRFSGLPAYWLELYKNGDWNKTLTGGEAKFTSFINVADGATNKIVLSAVDNVFKVYINGNYEGQFPDYSKNLSEGKFAVAAIQESGSSVCSYTNTWIWIYK